MQLMQLRRPCGSRGRRAPWRQAQQQGTTLVEVLVAMALFSFALLALITAHAAALRYTKMSQYRTAAVLLAADMGERLRANSGTARDVPAGGEAAPGEAGEEDGTELVATGFHAGDYDYTLDFQRQQGALEGPIDLCHHAASACTAAQMAATDLAQWRQLVRRQLPAGAVFMQRHAAEAAMDVWVAWRDPAVAVGRSDENPAPSDECPEGLGRGDDGSIRCVHVRIRL